MGYNLWVGGLGVFSVRRFCSCRVSRRCPPGRVCGRFFFVGGLLFLVFCVIIWLWGWGGGGSVGWLVCWFSVLGVFSVLVVSVFVPVSLSGVRWSWFVRGLLAASRRGVLLPPCRSGVGSFLPSRSALVSAFGCGSSSFSPFAVAWGSSGLWFSFLFRSRSAVASFLWFVRRVLRGVFVSSRRPSLFRGLASVAPSLFVRVSSFSSSGFLLGFRRFLVVRP